MRAGKIILLAMAAVFLLGGIARAESGAANREEEEKKKQKFVRKWSLGLTAGPYQPMASGSSIGFSLDLYVRWRFHLNFADDTSIGYTQFQYATTSTATIPAQDISVTVREVPLVNSLVVFLAPGETINPYLRAGPGAFYTQESRDGRENESRVTPGAIGGGGIIITTENFGLNIGASYILPDFSDTDRGAVSYGLALGLGF